MNLNIIANNAIKAVHPNTRISLVLWEKQDNSGNDIIDIYKFPEEMEANIQPANTQDLKHVDGYSETKNYKNFYINKDLSGLNLGLGIGRSHIFVGDVKYLFFAVKDDYKDGWTCIVGVQDVAFRNGNN